MGSPARHDVEIAVVGGGPAGLIAAIACAEAGFSTVLLAERHEITDRRTTALLDASVRMLDTVGLWQSIAEFATPLKVMRLIDDTGRLLRAPEAAFDAAEIGLEAFGYNVENKPLVETLSARAEATPHLVWIDTLAAAFELGETQAEIVLANGDTVASKLVVGADGRNSPSREAAGIALRQWRYDQAAFVANFHHEVGHNNTSTEFHTPTGPFTLVPLPGNRSSLVCVERPEVAEGLLAMDEAALNAEIERRAHSLLGAMELCSPRQVYPLSSFVARAFAQSRVALVGEAAHGFPPIGAQGLNLSLRDIATLAELCVDHRMRGEDIGAAQAMTRYDAARRPDVWSRTLGVDALNRALLSDFLPAQTVRGVGLYLANRVGPLRRFLMREGITPRLGQPKLMRGIALRAS